MESRYELVLTHSNKGKVNWNTLSNFLLLNDIFIISSWQGQNLCWLNWSHWFKSCELEPLQSMGLQVLKYYCSNFYHIVLQLLSKQCSLYWHWRIGSAVLNLVKYTSWYTACHIWCFQRLFFSKIEKMLSSYWMNLTCKCQGHLEPENQCSMFKKQGVLELGYPLYCLLFRAFELHSEAILIR